MSILKEISPAYSLEGLMLKLKLQYLGYLMQWANSLEKTLVLGKIEGKRRGRQRMTWFNGIADSMGMSLSKLQEIVKNKEAWCAEVHGVTKNQTWFSDSVPTRVHQTSPQDSSQERILEWVAISFLKGILLTQGSNPCLLHCPIESLPLSHWGSPNLNDRSLKEGHAKTETHRKEGQVMTITENWLVI